MTFFIARVCVNPCYLVCSLVSSIVVCIEKNSLSVDVHLFKFKCETTKFIVDLDIVVVF